MKYCSNCGVPIQDENVNFCPNCGTSLLRTTPEPEKTSPLNSGALTTLCILTILGSVFGIIKGFFYQSLSNSALRYSEQSDYMLGFLSALANIGTLTGAIFMLNLKRTGYFIYLISQIAGILISLSSALIISDSFNPFGGQHFGVLTKFIFSLAIVPSVVFIVLYTTLVRKQLR